MDWLEKTQDMVKTWMDSQEKMWANWTDSLEAPSAANWTKTVKTWESSFKNFIETQALWARMWMRNAATEANMEGLDEFMKSAEGMTNTWVEAQQQLWSNWFAMLKNFDPADMTDKTKAEADKAMQAWQEGMNKMLQTQREWADQFAKMTDQDKK